MILLKSIIFYFFGRNFFRKPAFTGLPSRPVLHTASCIPHVAATPLPLQIRRKTLYRANRAQALFITQAPYALFIFFYDNTSIVP